MARTSHPLAGLLALPLSLLVACTTDAPTPRPFRTAMTDRPPIAPTQPHSFEIHGKTITDDYFWLRERDNPEVRQYLEAENAWVDRCMADTVEFQETLFQEIKGRIKETDVSVPYRVGDWLYLRRTEEGQSYATYYRQPVGGGDETVILDVNALAENQAFMAVGVMSVSPDGTLLAYTTDNTGFREYTLAIKDLRSGELLADSVTKVGSVAWAMDNKTLFYTVEDAAKRPHRLYRHALGAPLDQDTLLFEEADEKFRVGVKRTLSDDSIVLTTGSHTTRESYLLPADRPTEELRLVRPRKAGHEYFLTQRGEDLFIRTNDQGPNFRLVQATTAAPDAWTEVVPHRDDVMLERVEVFADFAALTERTGGLRRIRFLQTDGSSSTLPVDDAVYELGPETNAWFDAGFYRYTYQSMVTPRSIYDYDVAGQTSTLRKQTEVLGGYDASHYVTARIHATASDGTKIPISLAYRKDVAQDGTAPLYLIGYGSYGASYPASFSHARISLLDRGVVCGIAHVRGGGEMGKRWHEAGRMLHKRNSFTDFISCTEHLIAEAYAAPDRVVVEGGSAGGLLMGAITNMRPDLFNTVILNVPFVDVLNTMLDETLPLTVGEFEEWGNPKIKEQFDYIASYCPYTNLERGAYPAMLVKTSFQDSQVMYWEPAKYVARLRTLKTNQTPLLFETNMSGGHGGSSGRYDAWHEVAREYAFLLRQVGITE